jgi:hypothetical protein
MDGAGGALQYVGEGAFVLPARADDVKVLFNSVYHEPKEL